MASYQVEIDSRARKEIRELPGHIRQRVLRTIRELETNPRPPASRALEAAKAGVNLGTGLALYRIRLESWRIVYLVEEQLPLITVLTVRRRPPYQYGDLAELLAQE